MRWGMPCTASRVAASINGPFFHHQQRQNSVLNGDAPGAGHARSMLDSHVRIAMQNDRIILSDDDTPSGEPGGFGPIPNRGPDGREWHTFAAPLPSLLVASCC